MARLTGEAFLPNLYVVARFLDHLAARAHTRSSLQAAAGVNYDVFRRYLDFLERKGYAETAPNPDGGSPSVRLTPEGHKVRAELLAWIAQFLGPGTLGAASPPARAAAGQGPAAQGPGWRPL